MDAYQADAYQEVVDRFYDVFSTYGEDDDVEIELVFEFAEEQGLSVKEANEAYYEARDQFI